MYANKVSRSNYGHDNWKEKVQNMYHCLEMKNTRTILKIKKKKKKVHNARYLKIIPKN